MPIGREMVISLSSSDLAASCRLPCHSEAERSSDVGISWQAGTKGTMFDRSCIQDASLCFAANFAVILYREIATVADAPSQ